MFEPLSFNTNNSYHRILNLQNCELYIWELWWEQNLIEDNQRKKKGKGTQKLKKTSIKKTNIIVYILCGGSRLRNGTKKRL